ncbi:MAG: hypothetical protein IPH04_09450 [Saprospirales bacterium]|nr:hypothetical protein [Saprospirales bacterium]
MKRRNEERAPGVQLEGNAHAPVLLLLDGVEATGVPPLGGLPPLWIAGACLAAGLVGLYDLVAAFILGSLRHVGMRFPASASLAVCRGLGSVSNYPRSPAG